MGLEYTNFDDSSSESYESSDVVCQSSHLSHLNPESSKITVSSGNFSVSINATSEDFNVLYKKWVDCINLISLDSKSSTLYRYRHLFHLNSSIKSTILRLNNYEGVLLFSHVVHTNRNDDEFMDSFYILVVQWFFCIKYNFKISEFPFLGSFSTFNNLIFGLRSVSYGFSRFLLKLLNSYPELDKYIYPILGHRTDGKESESNNQNLYQLKLIEMFPVFSSFQSSSNLKTFSEELVSYIFDLNFSFGRRNIPFNYDDSLSVLKDLWNLLNVDPLEKRDISYMKVYMMLLDIYTDISFNNGTNDCEMNKYVEQIMDLYSNWLKLMESNRSKLKEETNKVNSDNLVNSCYTCMVDVKVKVEEDYEEQEKNYKYRGVYNGYGKLFEEFKAYVVLSYCRFLECYFNYYYSSRDLLNKVVDLTNGFLKYGSVEGFEYLKEKDLVLLDTRNNSSESMDIRVKLQRSLFKIEETLNSTSEDVDNNIDEYDNNKNKNNKDNNGCLKFEHKLKCIKCKEPFELEGVSYTIKSSYEKVIYFCSRFYSSIGNECGLDMGTEGFKMYFTTSLTTNVEYNKNSWYYYYFPKELAQEYLDELCKTIDKRRCSVSSLFIYNEKGKKHNNNRNDRNNINSSSNSVDEYNGGEENDYNNQYNRDCKSNEDYVNSAMYCTVMAIASLMDDDVYLDFSGDKMVRVVVDFRSNYSYSYSDEVFQLIAKLLYLEISDDTIMSIEYRNCELMVYRTMLLRYLLQLSISPINRSLVIELDLRKDVDFKEFVIRLFKYLNFRTNYLLMDKIVFEKYITTRVLRLKKEEENKNKNKGNKRNNSKINKEYNDKQEKEYNNYKGYENMKRMMNGVERGGLFDEEEEEEESDEIYDDHRDNKDNEEYYDDYELGSEYDEEWDGKEMEEEEERQHNNYESGNEQWDRYTNNNDNEQDNRDNEKEEEKEYNDRDNIDKDKNNGEDKSTDISLDDIMNTFGFLEYYGSNYNNNRENNSNNNNNNINNSKEMNGIGMVKINVKSEDVCKNDNLFDQEYFFSLFFKLFGVLRYFVDKEKNFGSDVLDQFSFKYYLRLCSNDFYDAYNTSVIYSRISSVVDTNEYGQKTDNTVFVKYFGECEDNNDNKYVGYSQNNNKITNGYNKQYKGYNQYKDNNEEEYNNIDYKNKDNNLVDYKNNKMNSKNTKKKVNKNKKTKGGNSFINVPMINLLKLNNRYTKRSFYSLTYMFCSEFFRYVPLSGVSTLLCVWASSLPTDSTSTVKSQKIATARYVVFMLISRICAVDIDMSVDMFTSLETLVSAINVIFVNLEIIYRQPSSNLMCEVISSDEEFSTPKPCDILSQELDLSSEVNGTDSEFYEKLVNNYKAIKTANIKRYCEKRNTIRARNKQEVQLLLQVSCLLSEVLDSISKKLENIVTDVDNGFLTELNDSYMVSCVGMKRTLFYSVINFLDLVDNTISSTIRTCILSTLYLTDSELVDDLNIKSNNLVSVGVNVNVKSEPSEYNTPVNTKTKSQLMNNISQISYKNKEVKNKIQSQDENEIVSKTENKNRDQNENQNQHLSHDQDQNTSKTPSRMNENTIYSEFIAKIKLNKNNIKSRLNLLSEVTSYPDETISSPKEIYSWDSGDGMESVFYDVDDMPQESLEDDLDDFIDFDTDKHLSMLTYDSQSNPLKNRKGFNVNKKLKLTNLRDEWKFIIKSHLI